MRQHGGGGQTRPLRHRLDHLPSSPRRGVPPPPLPPSLPSPSAPVMHVSFLTLSLGKVTFVSLDSLSLRLFAFRSVISVPFITAFLCFSVSPRYLPTSTAQFRIYPPSKVLLFLLNSPRTPRHIFPLNLSSLFTSPSPFPPIFLCQKTSLNP